MIKEIKQFHDAMTEWRCDIHQHPVLKFEENRTADLVSTKLEEFGIEIRRGLAKPVLLEQSKTVTDLRWG